MAEEFKVRAVDFEEKSAQEIERDLLAKAENENNQAEVATENTDSEDTKEVQQGNAEAQQDTESQDEVKESSLSDDYVL